MPKELKLSNNRITFYVKIFTIIISIVAFFINKRDESIKNELRTRFNYTIGYFLSYGELADSGTPIVEYYYYVNNKKYFGLVYSNTKYKYCKYHEISCQSKRFWVIYSPNNPKRSLIDLTIELQDNNYPKFPTNMDNFK